MDAMFQTLLDWVAQNPVWSWTVIFLVSLAESLAIVGLVVPGVVIMFGIGALIAAGSIEFWPAMAWAVAGAVSGDSLSFWLGRHYQQRLTNIWPFSRHPQSLERGVDFFHRFGGKSVAFGRFFGPVRAVIPLVAGMMRMDPWRFLLANVLSALAWAPAYLLPGIVFGASMELAAEVAFRLVVLLLLLVAVLWFTLWLIRQLLRRIQPHSAAFLQWLLNWGERHPRLEQISAALADPEHPETKGLTLLASLLVLGSGLFMLVLGSALDAGNGPGLNYAVLENLQSLRTPWADQLMLLFTGLADIETMALLVSAVLLVLLWRGQRQAALHWLAAAAFCLLAIWALKFGLRVPRPDVTRAFAQSYAFPSGHTLWATVIYGFLSVMLARAVQPAWRWIPYSLAGLIIVTVAFSRLYLGMHWLTDVLGSITLGVAWTSALGIAYHRHSEPLPDTWRLATTAAVSLLLVSSLQGLLFQERRLAQYAPVTTHQQMLEARWWQTGWSELPQTRVDSRHLQDQPLNLQYSGDLEELQRILAPLAWQPANMLGWGNLLKMLSPNLPLEQLPVLPQVHDGRHESMVLVKQLTPDRRSILRFWSSQTAISPSGAPLWIGISSTQRKVILSNLVSYAATAKPSGDGLRELQLANPKRLDGRLIDTSGPLLLRLAPALENRRQ